MHNNFDDFELFEQDPGENSLLREMYEAEMEHSMRWTYDRINKMGIERWMEVFPYQKKRKVKILESMMLWFADPAREEYEKSAYIQKALEIVKKETQTK